MVWKPRVTVAAISERNGRFLVVEELDAHGQPVLNQPAGHLEDGESLLDAVVREVLEETAHHFRATALCGLYRWIEPKSGDTYLRACFIGECDGHEPTRKLDDGIIAAHWLSAADIASRPLRSPLVQRCIDDYQAGHRYPLDVLRDL